MEGNAEQQSSTLVFVDKWTGEPCPKLGYILCTITDVNHRHVDQRAYKPAEEQKPTEGFAEVGPEWAALVKRLRAAQDNSEGIVLTARDVEVLNRALKALAAYIIDVLKTRIGSAFKAMGLGS